ncbi:MAG: hypothetical protein FJ148_10680 [Deltaproteobacteria bacterium]|nr:hypothetical protein [Deltaproteobacteria bacterium]
MSKRLADRLTPMRWIRLRYSALLLLQLLVFLVYPFVIDGPAGIVVMGLFIVGTLLAGAFSLGEEARLRSLLLVVPAAALISAAIVTSSDLALQIACILGVLAVSHQIWRILLHALQIERVSTEKVQGSLAVFFLLGLNWALIYAVLEVFQPGSFALGDPPQALPITAAALQAPGNEHATHMLGFSHLLFHSYMTLCATSYGSVAALTPPALGLTALETLLGSIYMAVLISQLMGLHLAFHGSRE